MYMTFVYIYEMNEPSLSKLGPKYDYFSNFPFSFLDV